MVVRTRFAPSPTGYMHIGNLRTALYAYLYARRNGGTFILRIEDTDRKRHVADAVQVIYDSLKLAGVDYDEGPDKDGGCGPYIQSERNPIYKTYATKLVEMGSAYRCFCATQEKGKPSLSTRSKPSEYDPCRFLKAEESDARVAEGAPYVIRQRIPQTGTTTLVDRVFGTVAVANNTLDDQILLKSDGYPTYNLANVIDDHLMGITHVIRGVEYLSSTPKYNLLYESFGWEIPEYVHLPHIVNETGKKLSKRAGDASFQSLIGLGYLPQTVVNTVMFLGWNPGTEQEVFNLTELESVFDIERINKSNAVFSLTKLDWFNGMHIRALEPDKFHALASAYYPDEIAKKLDTRKISDLIQTRVTRLTKIKDLVEFFTSIGDYPIELYRYEKYGLTVEKSREILLELRSFLETATPWSNDIIVDSLKQLASDLGFKTGAIMWPLRIALTGLRETPGGAPEIATILGQKESLARLDEAIVRLNTGLESKAP